MLRPLTVAITSLPTCLLEQAMPAPRMISTASDDVINSRVLLTCAGCNFAPPQRQIPAMDEKCADYLPSYWLVGCGWAAEPDAGCVGAGAGGAGGAGGG